LVIVGTRTWLGEPEFASWGWRIPFLVSIALLAISVWIRLSLSESPAFRKMKSEGKGSKAPLTESFTVWSNLKIVILALLGLTAGEAVVWYAGQFYALIFLGSTLKVEPITANLLIGAALVIGTPFFVIFGTLSDKIGRKPIIMAGFLLAALTYFPIFQALTHYANPALESAQEKAPVVVTADPASCHFQFELFARPVGKPNYTSSCDLATSVLAKASVSYTVQPAPPGTVATVKLGDKSVDSFEGGPLEAAEFKTKFGEFSKALGAEIKAVGYPAKADPAQLQWFMVLVLLVILVIYVTMVYAPLAAMLVEMFPTRIRYTSLSLPYHIGNGWLGGFLPTISFSLVALNGNIYSGLWYPIVVASFSFVVGVFFVRETKDVDILNS
jgi:Na+/melibiose symporter-like transporter